MTIVHISSDYPDALNDQKTPAIYNLVRLTSDRFDHLVYSLNRSEPGVDALGKAMMRRPLAPLLPIHLVEQLKSLSTLRYDAPGKGLYLKGTLDRIADWIGADLERRGIRPSLIQGHKLSMEGLVAHRVAARLRVPYALSLQGDTDRKILSVRRDLWGLYRQIYHNAAVVFPFTPWIRDWVEARLRPRTSATIVLPVITMADEIIAPRLAGPEIVSIFHLASYRRKNASALITASQALQREIPGYSLSIVGGGEGSHRRAIEQLVREKRTSSVHLEGAVPHHCVPARLNKSAGFVLASRRESFGMVFIEALLAGCPIVYPKDWAVDGFFDGCPFAIAVSSSNQQEITDAMRKLLRDQEFLKSALAKWQAGAGPSMFLSRTIADSYAEGVRAVIGSADEIPQSRYQDVTALTSAERCRRERTLGKQAL